MGDAKSTRKRAPRKSSRKRTQWVPSTAKEPKTVSLLRVELEKSSEADEEPQMQGSLVAAGPVDSPSIDIAEYVDMQMLSQDD